MFNQIPELSHQQLPYELAPSAGVTMRIGPRKLGEGRGPKIADDLAFVFCTDGSGRSHERRVSRRERQDIRKAIAESARS